MTRRWSPVDKGQGWDDNQQVSRTAEDDGTYSELVSTHGYGYDSSGLVWRRIKVDSTGAIATTSSGGGGAVTVADGADVAQGTTSDVAWSSGAGTVISLLKKIASAGGSAVSVADGADVAQGTTTDLSSASTVVGLLKNIKAALAGKLLVTADPITFASAQHVVVDTAPSTAVTGPLTDTQLRASAVPVSMATQTPDVTDRTARLLGHVTVDSAPTTAVTGTFFQVTQPVSLATNTPDVTDRAARLIGAPTFPTLTKGTQASTGLSVQPLRDAGRSYIILTASAVAPAISETLVTFTKNVAGTSTATQTVYTPTSGKKLRLQSLAISLKSAAAAIAFVRVTVRSNTAGSTTASSSILYQSPEVNTNSATSGTGAWVVIDLPECIEVNGDGTATIGISAIAQATTNIMNVCLSGYEY